MGILEEKIEGGRRLHTLGVRCLLGRQAGCDVRVDDLQVSAEHASLQWRGETWELRDLGSRNGTWVAGQRLHLGQRVVLQQGASFSLGKNRTFVLLEATAPAVRARHVATGRERVADGDLLTLPDEASPQVKVRAQAGGGFILDTEHGRRTVHDRETITVDGEAWLLELPRALLATAGIGDAPDPLAGIDLRIAVSRDEEHVEITVHHGAQTVRLPPRKGQYLLVLLARARLADREARPAEQGWIEREELCRMLRVDENNLNVTLHRLRKQLADLGVPGLDGLVAKRAGTGQIRLGVDRVEVTTL